MVFSTSNGVGRFRCRVAFPIESQFRVRASERWKPRHPVSHLVQTGVNKCHQTLLRLLCPGVSKPKPCLAWVGIAAFGASWKAHGNTIHHNAHVKPWVGARCFTLGPRILRPRKACRRRCVSRTALTEPRMPYGTVIYIIFIYRDIAYYIHKLQYGII